jgi:hypothetical protein
MILSQSERPGNLFARRMDSHVRLHFVAGQFVFVMLNEVKHLANE